MSAVSKIQWTERTWNPVRGCSVVSPGCAHCYAMKQAHRFSGPGGPYEGLTKATKAGPQWSGVIRTVDEALTEPLSWRKPQRVFVNSMSDLFHEGVDDWFIDRVFGMMACAPQHTFQVLTKRPARLLAWAQSRSASHIHEAAKAVLGYYNPKRRAVNQWPLPNCWLGVSAEDQQRADERIPLLLKTPAAIRFVSAEPLIGPIDLRQVVLLDGDELGTHLGSLALGCGIDWVIVGGESGPKARPCNERWIRAIAEQCQAAGVPVFVKQLGSVCDVDERCRDCDPCLGGAPCSLAYQVQATFRDRKGGDPLEWNPYLRVRQFPNGSLR